MVAHGDNFLASLQELFAEAGADGRDMQENFLVLKESLITFICSCAHMTSAKARVTLDLAFTDGMQPNTFVQLFPSAVKLDREALERLRGTSSGDEFVDELRTMIHRHEFRPLKRKWVQKDREVLKKVGEEMVKRKRIVKLRVRPSAVANAPLEEESMGPQEEATAAPYERHIPSIDEAEQAALRACDAMQMGREWSVELGGSLDDEDGEAEDAEQGSQVSPDDDLREDAEYPAPWAQLPEAPPMSGYEILDNAIGHIQDEVNSIPLDTWRAYSAKLIAFFNKTETYSLDFADRIHKIARICFDPEEAESIHNQDWERLRSAVQICAMLAEATCPEFDSQDREVVNDWVVRKLRNVEFVKRLLGSKERIIQLDASSPLSNQCC